MVSKQVADMGVFFLNINSPDTMVCLGTFPFSSVLVATNHVKMRREIDQQKISLTITVYVFQTSY
jgi:hypothetical protein